MIRDNAIFSITSVCSNWGVIVGAEKGWSDVQKIGREGSINSFACSPGSVRPPGTREVQVPLE